MVKRKKAGSCCTQEEKRPEDISSEAGKEASVPNREVQPVLQLTRTRSQNAPRLGSPSSGPSTAVAEDAVHEKQEAKGAVQVQRSSLRVTKRPRKDASPPPSASANPASSSNAAANKKSAVSKQGGADGGRTRRPWELWSIEDKNAFFEAVCEFGKDFESIQSYIAQRSKKKGVPAHCIKNKDQVRFFYYRTWHKIAKVMDIGEGREDVKKHAQELYGLINYAELRKKYSACINEKSGQLLTELVLTGSTMVKIRGKRIRIKTPVCRALKKLNNVEDAKDEEPPKLPVDVWVEFRPRTNSAWVQVQSLAQNPRVRTKTSLQRRLSNVLEHLQTRWKPLRLRQKEQVVASLAGTDCKALASVEPEVAQELRVWPSTPISPVSISAVASSLDVSFQCHRKKAALADRLKTRAGKPAKQSRAVKAAAAATAAAAAAVAAATATPAPPATTSSAPGPGNAQDSAVEAGTPVEPARQTSSSSSSGGETASQGSMSSSPLPPVERAEESPEDEAAKSLTLLRSMLEPDLPAPTTAVGHAVSEAGSGISEMCPVSSSVPLPPIESVEDILADGNVDAEGLTLGQLLGKAAEEARQGDEEEEDEAARRKRQQEEEEERKAQQELMEAQAKRKEEEDRARERSTKGWTAQEAGLMTIGELYLMMGCPSKIVLHYDFCPVEPKGDSDSKRSLECTAMLKKLLSLATVMFAEKNKQGPLSPPASRCGGSGGAGGSRSSAAAGGTPPSGKSAASRALGRSPSTRTAPPRPTLQQVQQAQVLENVAAADGQPQPASTTDQHVFVVPMGMAPRTHKQTTAMPGPVVSTNITHQEQLDRLVPGNKRGVRLRSVRKPLVVQRPLLPRADRRPVTLVQLLPSSSPTLTAVVQPLTATETLPQSKGLVKLIHPAATANIAGTATFDVQPVQMPLIDASSVALPVSQAACLVTTTSGIPAVVEATSTAADVLVASEPVSQVMAATAIQEVPSATNLVDALPALALTGSIEANKSLAADGLDVAVAVAPSVVRPLSPPNISSLLDISLPESLPSEGTAAQILGDGDTLPSFVDSAGAGLSALSALDTDAPAIETNNPLPSFSEVSDSSLATAFKLACEEATGIGPVDKSAAIGRTEGLATPPMSPFKLVPSAPDPNWLNGEGSNFSLSSLLNNLDSPLKITQVGTPLRVPEPPVLALESSSMDSISRLAPDVDTQLQCLMNENSVDYVAKFADLAAQIASSNSESKAT